MSYCRFSDGDVYMYASIYGGIECCACRLAPMVNTIFTKGPSEGEENSGFYKFMDVKGPCPKCEGAGCYSCMMHGSITFWARHDALQHLFDHELMGYDVPSYAIERLQQELEEIGNNKGLEKPDEPPSPIVVWKNGEPKRLTQKEADEVLGK